ncbi:MAG: glycosyltransferase [Halioglobus sp.]|nr:glycosyltransferase [Halioglobus sp.]
MERLLLNAAIGITGYADLTVIGPRGCREHLPRGVTVHEVPAGLGPFLAAASWQIIRLSARHAWAAAVGGSGLIAPLLLLSRVLGRCPTMVLLHGLDVVTDNRLYRAIFLPCIRRVDCVVANSANTRELAQARGVLPGRIAVVNPGTSLPPQPAQNELADFRNRHGIAFTHYLVFVGRLTRRKGLSRFLRHGLPQILRAVPDCGLVVVGQNPAQSLNRLGEEAEVFSAIEEESWKTGCAFWETFQTTT